MIETNYFRIGFMGSSCSGKTTTAKIIASDFGLELHEEVESKLLEEWISFGKIRDKNDLSPVLSREFQNKALEIREQNSKSVTGYISDRTAADLLVYNRIYVQPYYPKDYATKFTLRCQAIMRTYTHLFLFPLGILPLENNGFRTINKDYQRKIHLSLLQILDELVLRYVSLSSQRLTIDERVEEVKKCLRI